MTNLSERRAIQGIYQGIKVEYTLNPIANGAQNLFTVVGGRVLLLDLMGLVTTVIQTAATTIAINFLATFGGNAAMSVASADITADAVGTMYLMPAAAGGALTVPAGGAYLRLFPALGWVLSAGTISLTASAARTGGILWTAFYVPIDDEAYVEPA
jgi:hypothetical protein